MIEIVEKERIRNLNNKPENKNGKYVLYFMQASQRIEYNHALIYAIEKANQNNLPLLVGFSIMPYFPNANIRHYNFMLEGIDELSKKFDKLNINFVVKFGKYEDVIVELSKEAFLTVTDYGYLKFQREIRKKAAEKTQNKLIAVESDVVVPVSDVSSKAEPYAMTIRTKIIKKLDKYIKELKLPLLKNKNKIPIRSEFEDVETALKNLKVNKKISIVSKYFKGGYSNAIKLLEDFISRKFQNYLLRSDPSKDYSSNLSPYLHFGQISPIEIIIRVQKANPHPDIFMSFINELVIWRELSRNFCYYEENYDTFDAIPLWAKNELEKHSNDPRIYNYKLDDLENAKTHDKYWNTAQKELLITGKIHNYMRMYWGKKIIEWVKDFKEAFDIIVYLNDKYAIDGRDPNGYASICWCFGKFDRPFFERPIFGKIRYMNDKGLEKKFEMQKYIDRIEKL